MTHLYNFPLNVPNKLLKYQKYSINFILSIFWPV